MKDSRIHLRIPAELKNWAADYALGKNTNLSSLVVSLLTELRKAEEKKQSLNVEQV